jgi:hypothetical protein
VSRRRLWVAGRILPGFAVPVAFPLALASEPLEAQAAAFAAALRALGHEAPEGSDHDTISGMMEGLNWLAPSGWRFGVRADCEDAVGFWAGELYE